ncbi:MAG: LuxR C-terminal-related transcriptional regulator [Bacteroidota bacterium]|nr:LuxR C-terminal-related transcriptional regulator [Bacteroidota bacterium]
MGRNYSIEDKIASFSTYAEEMPGVVIIHDIVNFNVVYMTSRGLELLGTSLQDLKEMRKEYYERFFNNDDAEYLISKLTLLLQNHDPKETFTYFQQVRLKDHKDWVWHISSTRIFYKDEMGNPTHTITIAIPIDQMKHIPQKAERILAENKFFKNNIDKFLSLGDRAKEILKLVALGKSSSEIADELHISVETVSTHRKLIKQKLGITTTFEFMEYALAFDLI